MKRYIFMLSSSFIMITFLFFASRFAHLFVFATEQSETEEVPETEFIQEYAYELNINNIIYSGTYSGGILSGNPYGNGTFHTDGSSPKQFSYEGTFRDGTFHGEGALTYPDETCLKCTFSSGVPKGWGNLFYPDGSYTKIHFTSQGVPYGVSSTFDSDSSLIAYDFYYDGEAISSLMENASVIDYRKLYQDANDHYGDIIRIAGTVLNVYETASECFFKVEDVNHNIYWGNYKNTHYLKYDQSIMPTLYSGDTIELYAFFQGIEKYDCPNDLEDFGFSYPKLVPITASIDNTSFDRKNPSFEYEEALRFPYHYMKLKKAITGEIEKIIYDSDTDVYLKVSDEQNNKYYVFFDKSETAVTPVPGDNVKIKGTYYGLYKEKNIIPNASASLYVCLKGTTIKYR